MSRATIEEIYYTVGRIIENSQFLEWNLALIVHYHIILREFKETGELPVHRYNQLEKQAKELRDKMKTMTLGEILMTAKEVRGITEHDVRLLRQVLTDRNYIVHVFFKDNDFNAAYDDYVFLQRKQRELDRILEDMKEMNDTLCAIALEQKRTYDSIF